jgi:predicted AlkP superfamily pyrophosphatase or phosphodiesterase
MNPVFLILIDGLRPDALEAANAPNLKAFRARSSYTMNARSLMPTITLPCHMSIFYSVPSGRHGVMTNTFTPLARPLPSLVDQLATHHKKTAFFSSWDGFSALYQPGNLDFHFSRHYVDESGEFRLSVDNQVTEAVIHYVPQLESEFTFIYYGTTDSAGHQYGWMSAEYLKQIERVDYLLGTVLAHLPQNAVVLIQSDHGGHEQTHGTDQAEDIFIPWMIAGPGIKSGYQITNTAVNLLHTTPTLAHFLGIPRHGNWRGEMVEEVKTINNQ